MLRMPFLCGTFCTLVLTLSDAKDVQSQSLARLISRSTRRTNANLGQSLSFTEQLLARKIDEQMLFQALADIAQVDKVRYTGPPPRVAKNPTAPGAKNPVVIPAYTFLPKKS